MDEILHPGSDLEPEADFPDAPAGWTKAVAETVAKEESIELGEDHWMTVRALQEYYAKSDKPYVRQIHDALAEKFHAKGGMRYLYELFPAGPVAQGCRLAGLQAPSGSTDLSFGSVQ